MRRASRFFAVAALLAASISGVSPASQPAPGGPSLWGVPLSGGLLTQPLCDQPINVPGQGPSCRAPDGSWQVLFGDGTSGLTHGPDGADLLRGLVDNHADAEFAEVTPRKPSCVTKTSTQYHIQMVYASAADKTDRYTTLLPKLRAMAYRVNGKLYEEAAEYGRRHWYRMACSGGEASVRRVKLPTNHAGVNYSSVVTGVRLAGYTNPLTKYWVYYDGPLPASKYVLGQAVLLPDDDLTAANLNNFGPSYGVFYGRYDYIGMGTLMHEGAHSLGAVQSSAPNATPGGHCIDDSDVMCYVDSPSVKALFRSDVCGSLHFDCRHNDYYHPAPSSRNYLYTHWNMGSPFNRFFRGCSYVTGDLTLGAPGRTDPDYKIDDHVEDWEAVSARTHSVSSSCDGHRYALYGGVVPPTAGSAPYPPGLPVAEPGIVNDYVAGALGKATAQTADYNICFYKSSKLLRCDQEVGEDSGVVPVGTTKARIYLNAGAPSTYVFSIV